VQSSTQSADPARRFRVPPILGKAAAIGLIMGGAVAGVGSTVYLAMSADETPASAPTEIEIEAVHQEAPTSAPAASPPVEAPVPQHSAGPESPSTKQPPSPAADEDPKPIARVEPAVPARAPSS
jgi:hypothetical protein